MHAVKLTEHHFPEAPKILVEPPGPKARAILEMQKKLEGKVERINNSRERRRGLNL